MRSHSSFIVSASPSQVNKDKGAWGGGGRKEHNYKKKKKSLNMDHMPSTGLLYLCIILFELNHNSFSSVQPLSRVRLLKVNLLVLFCVYEETSSKCKTSPCESISWL